jgi:hypothetical protein
VIPCDPELMRLALALPCGALPLIAAAASAEPDRTPSPPSDCTGRLAKLRIFTEPVGLPEKPDAACAMADPVRLLSADDPALAGRRIRFPERPTLTCAMAERFARFTADVAAPLALGVFGKELSAVATGPGYECRPRNRQPGAKPSSHGLGLAVDVMSFELHGGRRVTVEKPDDAEAARFVAAVRAAACGAFNTVLGPGADVAHANHLHIDIEPRGRDGRSKLCQ